MSVLRHTRNPEDLTRWGPIVPVLIAAPKEIAQKREDQGLGPVQPIEGWGLIDTGSPLSGVHYDIAERLQLRPVNVVPLITGLDGVWPRPVYSVETMIPGWSPRFRLRQVVSLDLRDILIPHPGQDGIPIALIGRDSLEQSLFIYNGIEGTFTLAN